ncbi:carbonic anhydrase [Noviherbaspirillum saxi]|nr:carbonic anhydrase family protein [Noviherbaspirillum saxi]
MDSGSRKTSSLVFSLFYFCAAGAFADTDKAAGAVARAAELAAIRAKHDKLEREVAATLRLRQEELRKERGVKTSDSGFRDTGSNASYGAKTHLQHASHWAYEGETGPTRWGKLNPAWAKCDSGTRQSPIDIRDGIQVDLEPVAFDYKMSSFNVLDNGHTIQVNVGAGNRITLTGRTYELVQFHFHRPSEEKVDGRGFEMVAHLVHKDDEGRIAVVAVLIESGNPHGLIQTVWNNLPLEKLDPLVPGISFDVNQLLPQRREYYTYMGSLTTPPCNEGVLWIVLKEPIQVSRQQIAIFARLYSMNARPVQASSGRLIKESN